MFERVGVKHPECCQGFTNNSQCVFRRIANSQYCAIHGGRSSIKSNERSALKNYLIETEFGRRAAVMANSPAIKDLTDEIALTRATLESIAKLIKSDNDVLIFSDKINQTIRSVQILIESMQKLQEKNKELIDRETLMLIADGIIAVITQFIDDPDKQKEAGEAIYAVIITGLGGKIQVESES